MRLTRRLGKIAILGCLLGYVLNEKKRCPFLRAMSGKKIKNNSIKGLGLFLKHEVSGARDPFAFDNRYALLQPIGNSFKKYKTVFAINEQLGGDPFTLAPD